MAEPRYMEAPPGRGLDYVPRVGWMPRNALAKPRTVIPPGWAEHALAFAGLTTSDYRDDPNGWIEDVLGERPWSKQREINDAIVSNRYVAVRSCHDIGKSWDMSRIAAWWLSTRPVGQAFVVTTAPTDKQVKAILWRYMRQAHKAGSLRGRITLDAMWYMGDDELVAYGRKPADYDATAFQGIHARYVLVIIDEACGVPKILFDAVDSLATNEDARVVAIGNPDDPQTQFKAVCDPGSGWHVIGVSAFDSPNFTGEEVHPDVAAQLISPVWVEERKARWGEDSALYASKVLGEFTEDAEDAVVPGSWAAKCRVPGPEPLADDVSELGVDVGAGGDESVIVHRLGGRARIVHQDRSPDTMRTTGHVVRLAEELGVTAIKVDTIGIGKGVADRLAELGLPVVPVNVGETSSDTKRFPKLRDQLWWEIGRELSEHHAWDLSELPDDAIAQLCAPKYAIDSSGRVKIEAKKDTRQRIGASPDMADALLLAFYAGRPRRKWRLK